MLLPSSYTTDTILLMKTMDELGYKPNNILAQAAGFLRQGDVRRGRRQAQRHDSRASFSLDLAAKRPSVGKVNDMFKAAPTATSTTTPRVS